MSRHHPPLVPGLPGGGLWGPTHSTCIQLHGDVRFPRCRAQQHLCPADAVSEVASDVSPGSSGLCTEN